MSGKWRKQELKPAVTTSTLSRALQQPSPSPNSFVPLNSTKRAATWNGTPTPSSSSPPRYGSPQRPSTSGGGRPSSQMAMNNPHYYASNITSTNKWSPFAQEVIEQANDFPLRPGGRLSGLVQEGETIPSLPKGANVRKALGLPELPVEGNARQCLYCGCTKPWKPWQEHISMCEQIYVEATRRLRDREQSAAKQSQQATMRRSALSASYSSSNSSSSSLSSSGERRMMQQKFANRFTR